MNSFLYLPFLCSLGVVAYCGPLEFGYNFWCWTLSVGPAVAALLQILDENLTLLCVDGFELWQSDLSGEGGIVKTWRCDVDLSFKDLRGRQIIFIVWTLDDITFFVILIIWLLFYIALLIPFIRVSILFIYCWSLLVYCRSLIEQWRSWLVYCRSSQLCKARFIGYTMIVFFWKLWLFLPWVICLKLRQILFCLGSFIDVTVHNLRYLSIYWLWRSWNQVLWLSPTRMICELFSSLCLGCIRCKFMLFAPSIL